jgi:hypothetical protein
MVFTLRKDSSAIQKQAYWCEPSEGNVKMGLRKDLGRALQVEAETMGKTWKSQSNSWRKRPMTLLQGNQMLQK